MGFFKCKMCGGDLILEKGSSVAECEYCGTRQTVPSADNEKKMALFARANEKRIENNFDKAAGIYETIVADFPKEAEAYWGLILCKYGIEYVDDPATGKKIPTCHRASFNSLMDDQDFEMVMKYSDVIARQVYQEEARQIEALRKGIIEVSCREEPYDIFISYKDTDDNRNRTLDSTLAQDVYDMLTENGYRVFFSRVSLEDKLGQEYEPYIFAALNSAKIMLVFGTDYDYFNAVWVKNEWKRFLQLIARGEKKYLIPCYKNIGIEDIPEEFAKLQSQDLGKLGANQDLLRGIKKLLPRDRDQKIEKPQQEVLQTIQKSPDISRNLKRAFLLLESGESEYADKILDKVLDEDPENAEAYLGKLMAELGVRDRENLAMQRRPFDHYKNYERAVRFGDEKLVAELSGYNTSVIDREYYIPYVKRMNKAKTAQEYKDAAYSFKGISGFRDSDELEKRCLEKAEECLKEAERKAPAIAYAFKKWSPLKTGPTLDEKLRTSKAKIESLTALLHGFDELQIKACQLQEKMAEIESKKAVLIEQRKRLGFFAINEKRQIDEKLHPIREMKQEIAEQISRNEQQRSGYHSTADIERDIAKETEVVSDFEAQIEKECLNDNYGYDEALEMYLSNPDIIGAVNSIYPVSDLLRGIYDKNVRCVRFGRYVQKQNGCPEPIWWRVLVRESGRMLLLSEYALEELQFNEGGGKVTWKNSSLRKWMNESFLGTAFSEEEQVMISETTVMADGNPFHNTIDKVLLLNAKEAKQYFSAIDRRCKSTEYHKKKMEDIFGRKIERFSWWLCSAPVEKDKHHVVSFVSDTGIVCDESGSDSDAYRAVRPALWIEFNSLESSAGSETQI